MMAIGTIKRSSPLLSGLLSCLLATGCNSISQGPSSPDFVLDAALETPGLSLASYRPTVLRTDNGMQDKREWRVLQHDEQAKTFHNPGLNFSIKTTLSDVMGDMDGKRQYENNASPPDEFLFIPDIDTSAGFGFDIGYRWERYEMLLSWQETEYDASFNGVSKDTTISYVDLLFREYFWIDSHVQPFLVAGVGVSEANIRGGAQDASLNLSTGQLRDGLNLNVGAGLSVFVNPRLSVFGQFLYRFGRYQTLNTSAGKVSANSDVDSDGWELSLGVTYSLLSPRN